MAQLKMFMKNFARKWVLWLLKALSRHRMRKFKGKVVAVVGSVGKTSTKDAIFAVLNRQFRVRRSEKSMNSDFGLPLTILEIDSGYSSATRWTWFLLKGIFHAFTKDHSEILLVEMGTDKPGDMDFLTSIVRPDVVVWTSCTATHMDEGQFNGVKGVYDEDSKIFKVLRAEGLAIFNGDNSLVRGFAESFEGRKVIFGTGEGDDCRTTHLKPSIEGLRFTVEYDEKKLLVESGVIGSFQIHVLMPAIICGLRFGMEPEVVLEAIKTFKLPPGRMSLIEAANGALILDSSYNSSPAALKEALLVLSETAGERRRVALLGGMNELGDESETLHKMIGKMVPEYADVLITVGKAAGWIAEKALERGMAAESVHIFNYPAEALEFLRGELKEGDLMLVKGSQNRMRLERVIKELMKYPEEAKNLLVRQEKVWDNTAL